MADYAFGGNDEETAELKKLNAEVVRRCISSTAMTPVADRCSSKTAIIMKPGRSWFAPSNPWMGA